MNTATANLVFIVGAVVVLGGLGTWITIFLRNASRIARASDGRLVTDLAALSAPPTGSSPQVPASSTGSSIAWDNLPWSEPQTAPKPVVAPAAGSAEGKLAELNDLHARGLITDEELATARAKVLAD
jgi:hypothetical protein